MSPKEEIIKYTRTFATSITDTADIDSLLGIIELLPNNSTQLYAFQTLLKRCSLVSTLEEANLAQQRQIEIYSKMAEHSVKVTHEMAEAMQAFTAATTTEEAPEPWAR